MGRKEKSKEKYLGMENFNNQGFLMKLTEYNSYDDVVVEFQPPYVWQVKTRVDKFIKGEVINHYAPWICNFGIVGTKYPTHTDDGKHYIREYLMWTNMIKRCYDEKHRYKNPSYYDCECCDEWKYYENFYEWLHLQANYSILDSINDIAIDKDILFKGNRVYSPDKCCLVTQNINNIMLKSNSIRGDCVIGVFKNKRNKYIAQCGGKNDYTYLGIYDTEMDAFNVYKEYKENKIKKLAKAAFESNYITIECYNALMNYEVEITD